MNAFQLLALLVVGLLLVLSVLGTRRGRATRREGLFWSAVWLAAGVAIYRPDLTARVAKALGIGRGADLVLYCAVVVMLVGFLMVYVRLRRLRRELTLLVRHLAIRDAYADPTSPPASRPREETASPSTSGATSDTHA